MGLHVYTDNVEGERKENIKLPWQGATSSRIHSFNIIFFSSTDFFFWFSHIFMIKNLPK
jgi:hypothetical protein